MSPSTADSEATDNDAAPLIVGWREWVSLPELGIPTIKAKVDTGARTSAIDAFNIERIKDASGRDCVEFSVNPVQRDDTVLRRCQAQLIDIRRVTDSGGHAEERYFIQTTLQLGQVQREIELTLAKRQGMLFKMLLGRTSLNPGIIVSPELSYTLGRMDARSVYAKQAEDKQS